MRPHVSFGCAPVSAAARPCTGARRGAQSSGIAWVATLVLTVFVSGWPAAAGAGTVFVDLMQGASGKPQWSATGLTDAPNGSRRFLGPFNNEAVTLSLSGLAAHSEMTLEFDLVLIGSWDGNHPVFGIDTWTLAASGVGELLRTTFTVFPAHEQDYPVPGSAALEGALEVDTLGYADVLNTFGGAGDAVYRLSFTFAHSAESIEFTFSGTELNWIAPTETESWGLDNVRVTTNAVPEPSTVLLAVAGSLVVLAVRMRRRA